MISISSLIFINSLLRILLLSQLKQSTSEQTFPDGNGEWQVQSYVIPGKHNAIYKDILVKVHLSLILKPIVHPGSVLILTDCVTEFISEDFLLFSSFSLAILNTSRLSEINPGMFGEMKPFIVMHLPEESGQIAVKQIYDSFQVSSVRIKKWQPSILIIRKELAATKEQFEKMEKTFTHIRLYHDCTVYMIFSELSFSPTQQNSSLKLAIWEAFSIKEEYRIFKLIDTVFVSIHTGVYNGREVSLDNYAERRKDFQLGKFSASVKYDPYFTDWVKLEKKEDGSFSITGGYVSFLYRDLQMMMNFTEKIILGDSPMVFPNGTEFGTTANQLYSGEADLTLNQISFSTLRAKAFTFLQPTYHSLIHAFFKQPAQSSIRDIVISAFQKELWITLIGVWAMLVVAMKLRLVLLPTESSLEKFRFFECGVAAPDQRFSKEIVLWSVAAFSQKSWYLSPRSISLRLKVFIGSLTSLIAYTAYSASIVSHLAVGRVPVKTFEDLINFKFIFTVHEQSEPFQTLLEGMIESYNLAQDVTTVSTEKEISHLYKGNDPFFVKSTGMAFLSPADMFFKTALAFNHSSNFMCDHISTLYAGSYLLKSAMLVRKGSDYKEVLNYGLVYLRGRGLIDRNIESYNMRNFLKCIPMDQRDGTVEPTEFSDIFTITLVLFVGIPLACLILLVEMTYYKGSQPVILSKKTKGEATYQQAYFNDDLTTYYTA